MQAGKTAIVTGSTSGIGLGIARALAGAGANIVLNGFGEPDAIDKDRQRSQAQAQCRACSIPSANIADPDEIEDMVEKTREEFGGVDILVNNAGIQFVAPIEDFPAEKWNAIIAINLSGAFHTSRLAMPDMKKNGWGRIINVASAHALVASPFKSAYVAAKHGLAGLTKTVALELAEHGITANAICPGYVLTPLVQKQIPEQAKARGISEEAVMKRRAAGGAADQAIRRRVADRGAGHVPLLRRRRLDHRRPAADRRRLDRPLRHERLNAQGRHSQSAVDAGRRAELSGRPYRFIHREFMVITYETDPDIVRDQLPEPLEPVDTPLVHYEWIKMPDTSGFGNYTESGMVLPCRFHGEDANFVSRCISTTIRRSPPAARSGAFRKNTRIRSLKSSRTR